MGKEYCGICGVAGDHDQIARHMKYAHPKEESDELVLQDRIQLDQEDSNRVLAIGHKVNYEGNTYIISDIRVWHDLYSAMPGEKRFYPVFDLNSVATGRRIVMNVHIGELTLWHPPIRLQARASVLPEATKAL